MRRGEQRRAVSGDFWRLARTELTKRQRRRLLAGTRGLCSSSVPRAATAGPPRHLARRRTETARNIHPRARGTWEDAGRCGRRGRLRGVAAQPDHRMTAPDTPPRHEAFYASVVTITAQLMKFREAPITGL
jgi:hypothetical protein